MVNEPESSTMEPPTCSGRSSSKTMPLPGSRGAPNFDKEKPIELLRFIEQMEDLFKEYGIDEDQDKKRYLGKYMDQKTEFEWRAFETYDSSSSYEEFKTALIDDYPEAKMAGKGTLANLRKICKGYQRIHVDDFADLKGLTRSFKAEQKLLLKPPALVSNRELVDLFLGCLKEAFWTQVEHSLNIQMSKDSKKKSVNDDKVRRPEDPYDIIEVIEMAETIAGRAQGATSSSTARLGVNSAEVKATREPHTHAAPSYNIKLEDDLRELNNKVALLMDKFTTSERAQQSALQASRQEMNRLTESLMHQHVTTAPTVRQTAQPVWKMGPDGCWYCEEQGHFAMNCPHREEHIRTGKIRISGNKMFFALTGQPVPRGTNGKSAKTIVEEASNKENMAQSNLFASPGEVYTQTLEPGLIQLGVDPKVRSIFTNQVRDNRDDVIDNMKRLLDELAPRNVMMVNAPTQEVNVIENMKSVLSYLEGQQGQNQEAQYVTTRRAQAETQGQSGF